MRLVSWNVRKAVGLDWRRDPRRVLAVLEDLDADAVLLQEADKRVAPRRAALPPTLLEQAGFRPVGRRGASLGHHGNAVLLRSGIEALEVRRIDLPGLEPRGALAVEVESPRGRLWLCGAHLGLRRRDRRAQVAALLGAVPGPAVIGGDMNEWSRDPAVLGVATPWRMVVPGPSFHATRPVLALDRFLVLGVRLHAAMVATPRAARRASDHLPVRVEVDQE